MAEEPDISLRERSGDQNRADNDPTGERPGKYQCRWPAVIIVLQRRVNGASLLRITENRSRPDFILRVNVCQAICFTVRMAFYDLTLRAGAFSLLHFSNLLHCKWFRQLVRDPRVNKVEDRTAAPFLFFIAVEANIQTCYCHSLKALLVRREQLGGLHFELVRSLRVTNHDFSPGFHRVGTFNVEKKNCQLGFLDLK